MKKLFTFFLILVFKTSISQFGQMPPFSLEILPATDVTIPGFHSFAFAENGTRWLIIGGRTNGLHGMSSNDNFPTQYANNNIIVIDTANWQTYYGSLVNLPDTIADPLRSTNMQYYQDSNYLYMIGGFGWDSTQNRYVTFSTLSVIRVDSIIDAVISSNPIAPFIRQISDSNLTVCGGELNKLGTDYYLIFGHDFQGRYTDPPTPLFTQVYTNQIKKFNITDNGNNISVSNFVYSTDTVNFHRRDLNVSPIVLPNGNFALEAFGGVFQYNINFPYREPITISSSATTVNNSYQQVMSQYTCAMIPLCDTLYDDMYVTFLGGLSLYDYNPTNQTVTIDSLVPFIKDVTTLTTHANGNVEETVLPVQLNGLLGSNAKFIYSNYQWTFANDVIDFWSLPNQRTCIGYMFGGIRASGTNLLPTFVNDTLYRIFITPDFSISNNDLKNDFKFLSVYPNPSEGKSKISFYLETEQDVSAEIFDLAGNKIEAVFVGNLNKGMNNLEWNSNCSAGFYFLVLKTENSTSTAKVSVIK